MKDSLITIFLCVLLFIIILALPFEAKLVLLFM